VTVFYSVYPCCTHVSLLDSECMHVQYVYISFHHSYIQPLSNGFVLGRISCLVRSTKPSHQTNELPIILARETLAMLPATCPDKASHVQAEASVVIVRGVCAWRPGHKIVDIATKV
jgi:hypothetical protein